MSKHDDMTVNRHESGGRTRVDTGAAVLWSCAFLLGAAIIMQAGKLPANEAHAGMVATGGEYTVLTATSGRGDEADPEELLYILDSRSETLLVYEVLDVRQNDPVRIVDGGSLHNLFLRGRN